jgi:hypothetical protein
MEPVGWPEGQPNVQGADGVPRSRLPDVRTIIVTGPPPAVAGGRHEASTTAWYPAASSIDAVGSPASSGTLISTSQPSP